MPPFHRASFFSKQYLPSLDTRICPQCQTRLLFQSARHQARPSRARGPSPETNNLLQRLKKTASANTNKQWTKRAPSRNVPFEDESAANQIRQQDPRVIADNEGTRANSLTLRERAAFQRLFDSMVSSKPATSNASVKQDKDAIDAQTPDTSRLFAPRHVTLDAYPVELRAMAAQAQRAVEHRRKQEAERHSLMPEAATWEPEVQRVEKLLLEARTDTDLWNVLITEVFEPLKALDAQIRQRRDAANSDTSPKAAKRQKPAAPNAIAMGCSILFALAMKLLGTRTLYSHYANALLPTIKTHSWTTSILGVGTPLYNEYISHLWKTTQDLPEISQALREMDNAGLEFDYDTLQVLDEISRWTDRALAGDFGLGVKARENLSARQREVSDIKQWRGSVRTRLDRMAVDRAQRAEQERLLALEGTFGGEEESNAAVATQ